MSAEVAVKKRGRPKKVVAELAVEIEEAPKKPGARKTTKATTTAKKTSSAKKPAKVEDVKPSSPQKPKTSVLEEVKKLEVLKEKEKTNPTSKSTTSAHSSSSTPTTIPNKPAKTTTTPIKPQSLESSPTQTPAKASTSQILNEIRALPKSGGSADVTEGLAKETNGKTTGESGTRSTIERVTAADTPLKEVAVPVASTPNISDSTMANPKKEQSMPIKSTSPAADPKAEPRPKIPITELNSKIVSDLSARGGARGTPPARPGQLPENYKPFARKVTRTIIALPILLVTSYVLYERLVQGEEQKKLIRIPGMSGAPAGQKEEASKDLKPTTDAN